MIPILNIVILSLGTFLFTIFYIQILKPTKLEETIGDVSYMRCTTFRTIASVLEIIIFFSYIVFYFFPSPFLNELTWNRWISTLVAFLFEIPAIIIMFKGIKDSGKEGLSPDKHHKIFEGIYSKVWHPQTSGGVLLWFAIAIGSHSLFMVLYSLVWIPIYWIACYFEEADLVRRYGQDYEEYQKHVGMFIPRIK